jgi:hypothetical protein
MQEALEFLKAARDFEAELPSLQQEVDNKIALFS